MFWGGDESNIIVGIYLACVFGSTGHDSMLFVRCAQLLPLPASYPVSPDDSDNSDVQVCY